MFMPSITENTSQIRLNSYAKSSVKTVCEILELNEALEYKYELTSEGITKSFASRLKTQQQEAIGFQFVDMIWKFTGNGTCLKQNDCSINITTKKGEEIVTIPLYAKPNGYLEIRQEDLNRLKNEFQ